MSLKDSINSLPALEAVRGAWVAVDRLQQEPPAVAVIGAALLFHTYCRAGNLDLSEVLNRVERMSRDGDINRALSALREYVAKEVR